MQKTTDASLDRSWPKYRKFYLSLEFAVLFVALPALFSLNLAGTSPFLLLLTVLAVIGVYFIRSPGFSNADFFRVSGTGPELKRVLLVFALTAPLLLGLVLIFYPEMFLSFARSRPALYAMVMVLYPLLSAYPQEVLFRGFLCTRYKPLFGSGMGMVVASGLAFGFAHIIFLNFLAVALSAVGGLLFAYTYQRSSSLLLATAEHALYGCFIFTIGIGRFFYHGAVQG